MSLEALERRDLMAVAIFQQGLSGYAGQEDTVLYSREPDVNFGTEGSISPDQQDSNGVRQGLVKFDDIFGSDPGQIPFGSTIESATLTFNVVNDSNSAMQMSAYRMLTPWNESTATWNTFGDIGGVQASEDEASDLPPDAVLFDPDTTAENPLTAGVFDVTRSLEYWAAGAANNGWMLESAATNGWDFRTKESAQSQRPQLSVTFTAPSGAGEVKFLDLTPTAGEGDTGSSTVMLEVARLGGTTGEVSVDYAVTAGTATAGADFVASTGTVTFAEGETFQTVPVEILGDTDLEGIENLTVTLSGGSVVTGGEVATLTIGDDDALINEVLANVSNPFDETNREFIELIGTPGASLDDYYFVVFEAEEEENGDIGGSATGTADLVIDLTGQTFGANGLLVITPTEWAYTAAADTNVLATAALDGVGGVLEDASQTYALIYSPNGPMVQGTDYDTVGTYENATNQAIGEGVGILDSLPAGAQVVDSVGVVEGGGGDRDRTLAAPELGNPGIHVHQPTGINAASGNVTSDAVSRRVGQTLPNSIGVWFNGDIGDGDDSAGPIAYQNDSFFISVVAPDGAILTPGAPNVLRNVFFSAADQQKEIAEADGSVTVTIERTGDIANESIEVSYRTFDFGSATENVDFTAVSETLTFAPGEASKDVTINLLPDTQAEGFERFRIEITSVTNLTNADDAYLITNGRANQSGAINGEATITIADADVQIATFQNGANNYFGTEDAYLDGELVFDRFGQSTTIEVDQVKGVGEDVAPVVRPQQGLIKFDDLFGDAVGQVPEGSKIFDAFLTVNVTGIASGADVNFFRMLQDWEEVSATWFDPQGSAGSSIQNGVTPDDIEATSTPDASVADAGRAGLVEIPLNVDTVQSWANGSLDNFGWSIVSDSGSLWRFDSSEAFLQGTIRPELTILYTDPVEADPGAFSLAMEQTKVNEFEGIATLTINRFGGSDGAATVDWALTPGTGDLTDVAASSGSVAFADGELSKTFDIAINDDSLLESNETLNVTLSGSGLTFERDTAELLIRDNDFNPFAGDLLLNEIWINSPGNDPPHEFVELKGTAGIGLGSLYYVAVEGLVGDRTGAVEKVVDLGAYTSGSNGFTLLTPDAEDFAFNVPVGTTQIDLLGSIATENVASQNDSTTYMLLYSPVVDLTATTFDYDWNESGSLELLSLPGVEVVDSLGVVVQGVSDQLYGPGTNRAQFAVSDPEVDAVSRDAGSTARNQGSAWFGGDLFPAGDDYLLYEAAESFGLPVTGAALSPGEENVGAASALVSLTGTTVNADGTVTLSFNGPVSQALQGDGGFVSLGGTAISLTNVPADGNLPTAIPGIDSAPVITGLGTDTLTLSFTGANVAGGMLPTGSYQLNFVGNAMIANGRATDVANNGSQSNGSFVFTFEAESTPVLFGDADNDGAVSGSDLLAVTNNFGATGVANGLLVGDADDDGAVSGSDLLAVTNNFGATLPAAVSSPAAIHLAGLRMESQPDPTDTQVHLAAVSTNFGATQTMDAGYLVGDINGDGVVSGSDLLAATNNASKAEADLGWEDALDDAFATLAI